VSKISDDLLLAAGAGDKIVLFEMINSSLATLTFVEKHPVTTEVNKIINFHKTLMLEK